LRKDQPPKQRRIWQTIEAAIKAFFLITA